MAPPINVQDWYGDRHTCQIASGALASAILIIVFRHILFFFVFNGVWALTSDGFCFVSTALYVIKIFLLFCMCHFAMGLTICYKTAVFTLIFAVFLLNLLYSFRQMLPAIIFYGKAVNSSGWLCV